MGTRDVEVLPYAIGKRLLGPVVRQTVAVEVLARGPGASQGGGGVGLAREVHVAGPADVMEQDRGQLECREVGRDLVPGRAQLVPQLAAELAAFEVVGLALAANDGA